MIGQAFANTMGSSARPTGAAASAKPTEGVAVNEKSVSIWFGIGAALMATFLLIGSTAAARVPGEPIPDVAEPVSGIDVVSTRANDFVIKLSSSTGDISKFITYGWLGWTPNVVRWLYNDTNRNPVLAPTSGAAVASIQSAMNKWTAACNIQFVYDGPDRKSTRLNSSHPRLSRMPSSA